jgi:DsbE subfamily thiol:disulfide oxidoreductase
VPRIRSTALLAALLLLAACTSSDDTFRPEPVAEDRPLPDLSGPSLDGGTVDMAAFDGVPMVVNAWASWCEPCVEETPDLIALSREYADDGVRFLGINHGDQDAAARAFNQRMGTPYPSVVDPAGRFAADLGYVGLPATFVVDADGTIRWAIYGPTDADTVRPLIDDVLDQAVVDDHPPSG